MKIAVVIVAAGSGSRAGGDVPKQYRVLAGRSVLQRTVDAFLALPEIDRIVCVIAKGQRHAYDRHVSSDKRLIGPTVGGASRQASVRAGLNAFRDAKPEIVLIHDAARPFVTPLLVRTVIEAIGVRRGAMPGLPVADTLAKVEDGVQIEAVDRDRIYAVQTPQGFRYAELLAAHEAAVGEHTDDASLARAAGMDIAVVPGSKANIKLTTPEDFEMAEAALSVPDIRVGHGYDTHRWTAGDGVWLCGVHVAHDRSLQGHSDADVGLHALTDALLATVGDGDIGAHFPPSDEAWRGAASDQFLAKACDLVRAADGTITHVDVTLVCERPKIGPHRDAMRSRVAEIADLNVGRVSVKATTNEERGFVGRGEGMVALATATVVFP